VEGIELQYKDFAGHTVLEENPQPAPIHLHGVHSGSPTPVETEPGAVPADDGLGLRDDEDVSPAGPKAAEGRPEGSVQGVPCWLRPFAFEHGDLLSESQDLQRSVAPTAEEDADHGEDGEDEFRHELTLVTWRNVARTGHRLPTASY
jgi:hypothetical protein